MLPAVSQDSVVQPCLFFLTGISRWRQISEAHSQCGKTQPDITSVYKIELFLSPEYSAPPSSLPSYLLGPLELYFQRRDRLVPAKIPRSLNTALLGNAGMIL